MVGLGRLELPTSPLSGVRSSHLSYRPSNHRSPAQPNTQNLAPNTCISGGAGRDRTGDLLNANQALSQLSYSPIPPIAVLKCAGREINRGQLDAETTGTSPWPLEPNSSYLSGDRDGLTRLRKAWRFGVERLSVIRGALYIRRALLSRTPPTFSLRKEVIQPQVLLRLPCYDFTPIMNHTLGRCLPCGSACRLLVQFTFVM